MSQQFSIGKITIPKLRDYIIHHKVNKGDTLVLNPVNYEHVLEEIRHSGEEIPVPLNLFGVLLVKDNTNSIEAGKIQIVKNENTPFQ